MNPLANEQSHPRVVARASTTVQPPHEEKNQFKNKQKVTKMNMLLANEQRINFSGVSTLM